MEYDLEENKSSIDLSKEKYEPKTLLEHKDVECIRINECIDQFDLPIELNDYKRLNHIYI